MPALHNIHKKQYLYNKEEAARQQKPAKITKRNSIQNTPVNTPIKNKADIKQLRPSFDRTAFSQIENDSIGELVQFPSYDKASFEAESTLWKAVIVQALIDLSSRSRKKMAKSNRIKALLWINMSNSDFLTACAYAALDPRYVSGKAEFVKKNNPMIQL